MHRTLRSARPAAALTLALTATLVVPGAAFAGTPEPTPVTTTSTTSPGTSSTGTTTGTTSSTSSTGTTGTTTGSATPTTSTDSSTSATSSGTTSSTSPTTKSGTTTGPEKTTSPTAGLVPGGDAARYGLKAAAALPETSTDPTLVAAGFLERELAAGGHHLSQNFGGTDYADFGLTLDAVLALDAAGAGQTEAAAATSYVAEHVNEYIGPYYGPTELYAGATGKTLLVAAAQGVDPSSFGGVDLVATLLSLQHPDGRFGDKTPYTDPDGGVHDANTIAQSFAILGLHRAGEAPNAAALTFLRAQQCTDGGFRLDPDAATCSSDPDVSAIALQAVIALAGSADADAQQGLDYLAGLQGANGGIGGAGPTAEVNANSTGLAGQAFLAGGRAAPARAAQSYLQSVQYDCTAPTALQGGIAYTTAALASATEVTDQDRRSTAQAVLALAGTPLFVVSGAGADATAPDLACETTTSSTTTSSSSSTSAGASSTSTAGALGSTTSAPADPAAAAPVASAAPGSLAFTGSNVAAMALLALLLLAVGAVAIVVARRKGAHA